MKIDKRLNLVLPLKRGDALIYVHSTPVSKEVFERYFLVISKTFREIVANGLLLIGGSRVAALVLREVATSMNRWDGPDGVGNGLMNEIRRLSNVVVPGPRGWELLPFDEAGRRDLISEDEVAEAEGLAVFFTVGSWMHTSGERQEMLTVAADLWDAQITSSSSTEFRNSLPISIATVTSPASAPLPPATEPEPGAPIPAAVSSRPR